VSQRDLTITKELVQALMVACELSQTTISEGAAFQMAKDLAKYPEALVLGALERFRLEARSGVRLTPAEIIQRLPDGRPTADEAWAMIPRDEYASVVWTEEMRRAWAVASPLISKGEIVSARMAFLEAYRAEVMQARVRGYSVRWSLSAGHDAQARERAVLMAVELGRIEDSTARKLLPHVVLPGDVPLLEGPEQRERVEDMINQAFHILGAKRRRIGDDAETDGGGYGGHVGDGGREVDDC
jgi:hypothetical protein